MKIFHIVFLLLIMTSCGKTNKKLNEEQHVTLASIESEQELQNTLFFPDFGVYINNWKSGWKLGNHGVGCSPSGLSDGFIIGVGSAFVGTLTLIKENENTSEEYLTFSVTDREIWDNKLDIFLGTVDNNIKVQFRRISPRYENWILQNVSFIPPMTEVNIDTVNISPFPIIAPNEIQSIQLLLDFKKIDDTASRFHIWFKNSTSRLGVKCEIASDIPGELTSTLNGETKKLLINETITVNVLDKDLSWDLTRNDHQLVIEEKEGEKTISKIEIPIPKDYNWIIWGKEEVVDI